MPVAQGQSGPPKKQLTGLDRLWQEWKRRHPNANRQQFQQGFLNKNVKLRRAVVEGKGAARYGGYTFTKSGATRAPGAAASRRRSAGAASGLNPRRFSANGRLAPPQTTYTGGTGQRQVVTAIVQAAREHGWRDPAALVAIAMEESGLRVDAVGDGGCSHGLFQMNRCGGAGIGHDVSSLQNPLYNARLAARGGASVGAAKLVGQAAVSTYFYGFGRGANNAAATAKAMSLYRQAQRLVLAIGANPALG